MSIFSDRLKQLRIDKKATQKDVADYLGITDRSYQYYEYGNHEPGINVAIKLADYFNVSTDYLLGLTDISLTASEVAKTLDVDEISAVELLNGKIEFLVTEILEIAASKGIGIDKLLTEINKRSLT